MLISRHTHSTRQQSSPDPITYNMFKKSNVIAMPFQPNTMRINRFNRFRNRNNSLLMSSTWSIGARWHWCTCNLLKCEQIAVRNVLLLHSGEALYKLSCTIINCLLKWTMEFNNTSASELWVSFQHLNAFFSS